VSAALHLACPPVAAGATATAGEVRPERVRTGRMKPGCVARVTLDLLSLPLHLAVDEVVMRRYLAEPM